MTSTVPARPLALTVAERKYVAIADLLQLDISNASLLRMCLQAICESDGSVAADPEVLIPLGHSEFIALATRAGVKRSYRYDVYKIWAAAHGIESPRIIRLPRSAEIDAADGRTALYRLYDSAGLLLYIGITDNLRARMNHHAASQDWWPQVAHRTVAWYGDWDAADRAETLAIAAEKPVHNKAKVYSPAPAVTF